MKTSRFFYCIKQGLKSIYRNRTFSIASTATITCCLFLFGVFFCVLINFQDMVSTAETSVGVTTFFNSDVTEEKILEIKSVVELREEVESVEYTSPEEAWEQFLPTLIGEGEDPEALTNLEGVNPLEDSGSLTIYLADVSRQNELVDYLKTLPEIRSVNASQGFAEAFSSFSKLIGYASLGLIIILVAVAVFLIRNTVMIGITVRKEEIAIMKYIGATDMFVRGPFLVEGVTIGLLGSAIPVILLRFLYVEVVKLVGEHFGALQNILQFTDVNRVFSMLIPISLGIGLGIGFIGSYFTLRKHIRV